MYFGTIGGNVGYYNISKDKINYLSSSLHDIFDSIREEDYNIVMNIHLLPYDLLIYWHKYYYNIYHMSSNITTPLYSHNLEDQLLFSEAREDQFNAILKNGNNQIYYVTGKLFLKSLIDSKRRISVKNIETLLSVDTRLIKSLPEHDTSQKHQITYSTPNMKRFTKK